MCLSMCDMFVINCCQSICFRYLIDSRWFKQWKKYVGFDSWDMYNVGERSLYPGPIDNSGLFSGKTVTFKETSIECEFCLPLRKVQPPHRDYQSLQLSVCFFLLKDQETQALKEHLIDELDYVLVPTEAWNKLVSWYGCLDGQRPIVRKVLLFTVFFCYCFYFDNIHLWIGLLNVFFPLGC